MKKLFISIILITSCTKEISFDLPLNEPKITVNGFIEKGQTAKILLTNSTDPFNMSSDFLNPDFFQTNVIQNATVVIIDKEENITDTLKTTPFGISDTWFYNYEGSNILGEEGKTYHLEITHNNEDGLDVDGADVRTFTETSSDNRKLTEALRLLGDEKISDYW